MVNLVIPILKAMSGKSELFPLLGFQLPVMVFCDIMGFKYNTFLFL